MGLYYYDWVFGEVITAARLNAPWTAAGHLDLDAVTSLKDVGQAATPIRAIYLDNTVIDGGTINFNAGILSYLQSDAAGTTLTVGGFTTIDFAAATAIDFNASTLSGISDLGTIATADINAGTWQGTIDGNWTAAGQTCADLGTVTTADINAGTWQGTIDGNWTAAGQTCADLGTVTTADINAGSIDGTTIGATVATTGVFTTLLTGATATFVDFPSAQAIFSTGNTAIANAGVIGLVSEALSAVATYGSYSIGFSTGAGVNGYGVYGIGVVDTNTSDAYGGYFTTSYGAGRKDMYGVYAATQTSIVGYTYGVYSNPGAGALGRYAFYGVNGDNWLNQTSGVTLVGATASVVDFPSSQAIISNGDTTAANASVIALTNESLSAVATSYGSYNIGRTEAAGVQGIGVYGRGVVNDNTSDAYGGYFWATYSVNRKDMYGVFATTSPSVVGYTYGVYSNPGAGALGRYSFYGAAGEVFVALAGVQAAANNAAAAALGIAVGGFYRTNADPSILCIRSA